MPYDQDDTIVAVASPPGGAARGILRLSGPNAIACVRRVFRADRAGPLSAVHEPVAVGGSIVLSDPIRPLSAHLYLWPTSRSYTGQPAAEIHTLGSPPLLEGLLEALCVAGARLAKPGEFTLRAFLAGRLDLTQAEAVLGVIDADDSPRFDVALRQLAGGLAGPLGRLRSDLIELLAHLEAGFDFADEDLPFISSGQLLRQITEADESVARLAGQMTSRRDAAELARVVLVGWPNTGKSSLFNRLTEGPGALVSECPGTTRDYLTAEVDLEGARCLLVDTAGIEPRPRAGEHRLADAAQKAAQKAAQEAAQAQVEAAHVRLFCIDSSRPLNDWEREQLGREEASRLVVLTKADLRRQTDRPAHAIAASSVTGEGVRRLRNRLREAVLVAQAGAVEVVAGTAVRCRESLRQANECLGRAADLTQHGLGEELVAAEVRTALESLGKVVGAVYTDDILDTVFSRFCIGK